jgi:hypothetical protein
VRKTSVLTSLPSASEEDYQRQDQGRLLSKAYRCGLGFIAYYPAHRAESQL